MNSKYFKLRKRFLLSCRTVQVLTILLSAVTSIWGQSTVQFIGFEEFSIGTTPSFVRQDLPNEAVPQVADAAGTFGAPPFEGQKYLLPHGMISIQSPDGQAIQSYSFHYYISSGSQGEGSVAFIVAGQQFSIRQFDSWQTMEGTFSSPVQRLSIGAFTPPEFLPARFGIDAVEFVTIPEPQTINLFAIGLGATFLWQKTRRDCMKERHECSQTYKA